jgi:signal transduction histidine kinase
MRAKQSSTASGIYSRSGTLTPDIPIPILVAPATHSAATCGAPVLEAPATGASIAQGEGLLHDARNLMGAVGLYCDLLLVPGVLQPQHRRYAEELRLLGARSGALMEHLTLTSLDEVGAGSSRLRSARPLPMEPLNPVSLRSIVERCSGLLSRMAGGRPIEISYGAAASMPILVAEESIERILANLVRNAAAALDGCKQTNDRPRHLIGERSGDLPVVGTGYADTGSVGETSANGPGRTNEETPGAVRIGVGLLVNRVGDSRPWPFQRVRLAVEDSGCGMTPQQLQHVLSGAVASSPGNHGIGLHVVRELVADSGGEIRMMSAPGVGTRVQIEWPMAAIAELDCADGEDDTRPPGMRGIERRRLPRTQPPHSEQERQPLDISAARETVATQETRAARVSLIGAGAARSRRLADPRPYGGRRIA